MSTRQTTGFVESPARGWSASTGRCPTSARCLAAGRPCVNIPYWGSKGPLHLLVDSTGIKVEGEGEWHPRKHSGPKWRVSRKIHPGIDEETLEIRAVEITGSHIGDAAFLPDLLGQSPGDREIGRVTAGAAARNEALGASKYLGRALWRRWSGYHRRSRVETKMHCVKLLGQRLMARDFDRPVAELLVRIAVPNGYTAPGIPVTEAVG